MPSTAQSSWQPTCSIALLQRRAWMLERIRAFFAQRHVLEVETPLLSHASGTDPQLAFFTTTYYSPPQTHTLFLQTSPEFAMKRLLASGCGSIYQICKAFRNNEVGRFHNPEFTLLEWYRVGFDLHDLMDEVEALFNALFDRHLKASERLAYSTVFAHYTGLDALTFSYHTYCDFAKRENLQDAITLCGENHALWLDFLFSFCVQPHLGKNALCLIYGYPACQSSLARINATNPSITDRVEVFINGVELGNGFYELTHAAEQNARFDAEISARKNDNLPQATKDTRLLAALDAGLPDCAGIAIGLDRVLMMLNESASISDVLSFDIQRA